MWAVKETKHFHRKIHKSEWKTQTKTFFNILNSQNLSNFQKISFFSETWKLQPLPVKTWVEPPKKTTHKPTAQ